MNKLQNELRLGNYVYWDNDIVQITGLYESSHSLPTSFLVRTNVGETHIERIKPIKITHEMYQELGGNFRIDEGWITTDDDGTLFCCDDQSNMVFAPNLEYVHQLQNLHFSLTGKELVFKKCAGLV